MFAKCVAVSAYCLIAALVPAQASSACRTYAEARQMFRTSHLYWHTKDHCWDASPVPARRVSIGRPVRYSESSPSAAVAAKPSNEVAKINTTWSSPNSGELWPATGLPGLRHWSETLAMAEPIETTSWIDRWPDQPTTPPSPPVVTKAAAGAAFVIPRGMVAGIMMLVLSLAMFEVLFGGTNLRWRLMFSRRGAFFARGSRRVVPKASSSVPKRTSPIHSV
jgi:hypothetical protein